jgi:hypothetical protein
MSGDVSAAFGVNHWLIIIPAALLFSGVVYFVNQKVGDNKVVF